jgi:hypothetical protein
MGILNRSRSEEPDPTVGHWLTFTLPPSPIADALASAKRPRSPTGHAFGATEALCQWREIICRLAPFAFLGGNNAATQGRVLGCDWHTPGITVISCYRNWALRVSEGFQEGGVGKRPIMSSPWFRRAASQSGPRISTKVSEEMPRNICVINSSPWQLPGSRGGRL